MDLNISPVTMKIGPIPIDELDRVGAAIHRTEFTFTVGAEPDVYEVPLSGDIIRLAPRLMLLCELINGPRAEQVLAVWRAKEHIPLPTEG